MTSSFVSQLPWSLRCDVTCDWQSPQFHQLSSSLAPVNWSVSLTTLLSWMFCVTCNWQTLQLHWWVECVISCNVPRTTTWQSSCTCSSHTLSNHDEEEDLCTLGKTVSIPLAVIYFNLCLKWFFLIISVAGYFMAGMNYILHIFS